jgi:hypothetical protein
VSAEQLTLCSVTTLDAQTAESFADVQLWEAEAIKYELCGVAVVVLLCCVVAVCVAVTFLCDGGGGVFVVVAPWRAVGVRPLSGRCFRMLIE